MTPFIVLFALLAMLDLALIASGHDAWRWYSKPFLMPILAVGVASTARWHLDRTRTALVLGLIASAAGDTVLLRPSDSAFVLGTIAFGLTQAFYLIAFANAGRGVGLVQRRPWLALIYAAVWLGGLAVLWPHLHGFAGLIAGYSALLTAMGVAALNLVERIPRPSATLAAIGAVLFMSSDTALAFARFDPALAPPQAPLVVMLTYALAQALIVSGLAARLAPSPPAGVRP
jgi:uncharacterized membrane protein YhhN